MTTENTNIAEHCCCHVPTAGGSFTCRECGNEGKSVAQITVKSLIKKPRLDSIHNLDGFCFCETPDCEVVYFSNGQGIYLNKTDVAVRVGVKEADDPIPVCYCFGWTRKNILDQIRQQGFSTAVQEIGARTHAGECACEVNNPSGRCCLGEVITLVKALSGERQEIVS